MAEHSRLPARHAHTIVRRTFADDAARLADTGPYVANERGIVALVQSTGVLYRLATEAPVAWVPITDLSAIDSRLDSLDLRAPASPTRFTASVSDTPAPLSVGAGVTSYWAPWQSVGFADGPASYNLATGILTIDEAPDVLGEIIIYASVDYENTGSSAQWTGLATAGTDLGTPGEVIVLESARLAELTPQSSFGQITFSFLLDNLPGVLQFAVRIRHAENGTRTLIPRGGNIYYRQLRKGP